MLTTGDLALCTVDHAPGFYCKIADMNEDKNGLWRVQILVLTFPPQKFTWYLTEEQLAGEEFSFSSVPVSLSLVSPAAMPVIDVNQDLSYTGGRPAKVVSLAGRRQASR